MTRNYLGLSFLVFSLALGCGDDGTTDTGGSGPSDDSTSSESGTDTQTEGGSASASGSGSASGGEAGSASGESGSGGDGDGDAGDGDGDTGLLCGDLECAECYSCAAADPTACLDEKLACTANPACVLIETCVLGCGAVDDPGFEQCHDDCADGMLGEDVFKALGECLACTVCDCPDHPEC
jgi:hypothetical protein